MCHIQDDKMKGDEWCHYDHEARQHIDRERRGKRKGRWRGMYWGERGREGKCVGRF